MAPPFLRPESVLLSIALSPILAGAEKNRGLFPALYVLVLILFRVFYGPVFPNDYDLDLSGIFQFTFDLFGDVSRHQVGHCVI